MGDRRRGLATATVGAGLVATSAHTREHAIRNAERITGVKRQKPPSLALLRRAPGLGRNRALWGAGVLTGVAGGAALGVGAHDVIWPQRRVGKAGFLREGLQGTREAVNQKVDNVRQPAPWEARAAALGTGGIFGGVGSQLAHKIIDRKMPGTRLRPGLTALAGTAAVAASLPVSSRVTRRVAPGYELTPTGVRRRKTPPVRPSRMANVVETRSGRGLRTTPNARRSLVPSDRRNVTKRETKIHLAVGRSGRPACGTGPRPSTEVVSATRHTSKVTCSACKRTHQSRSLAAVGKLDTNYVGHGLTDRQKRARVYAAGAVPGPFVGPISAARAAAHYAPPEQKRSAAALQYGGSVGGGLAGAAGGAYGAAALARRSPGFQRQATEANRQISNAKRTVGSALSRRLPGSVGRAASRVVGQEGPGRASRLLHRVESSSGRAGRGLTRAARPLREAGSAAAVGGLGGKMAGGLVGGYLGYSEVLRREHARNAKIGKLFTPPAMTRREQVDQYHRRRRNLGLGMLTTTTGALGVTALAASHGHALPKVGPTLARHQTKIERAGLNTALIGGGIGAVQGAQNIGIQRRDLAAQRRKLRLEKMDSSHFAELPKLRRVADRTEAEVVGGLKRRAPWARGSTKGTVVRRLSASDKAKAWTGQSGLMPPRKRIGKIDTTMSSSDAKRYSHQYGIKGPLPKGLPREEKMRAYEGRYIAAGGPKGERWHKRADAFDRVTGGALAAGGVALTGQAAHDTHLGRRVATRLGVRDHALLHQRANKLGLAAGGVGALSELAHRHAEHKQAHYSNSAAGVAASALRRMRDYTPD